MNSAAVLASDVRRKCSPTPVHEMAQLALSAKVPAPMTAESPTRPHCWFTTPPVDVAAARLPHLSRATAPTVPSFALVGLRMIKNNRLLFLRLCQLRDTRFGQEILSVFEWYAVFPGEPFRAFADQEDVLAFLHDGTGKQHGIPDAAHAGDRAGVERAAIHDRRVALDGAVDIQDRTAARVVEGVVFKQHDAMRDRIERRRACLEEMSACFDDMPKRSFIPLRGINSAGAAVDHKGKTTHSRTMPHDRFLNKRQNGRAHKHARPSHLPKPSSYGGAN